MKSFRFFFVVSAMVLALLFVLAAPNANAGKPKEPPLPPDTRKLIKSVDVKAGSLVVVNLRDKSLHTYAIYELTVITVNNVKGTIADIKPGMVVDDYMERDDTTLDSLSLSGYGTPAPDKSKAKKK
jgi:hypothetical protein